MMSGVPEPMPARRLIFLFALTLVGATLPLPLAAEQPKPAVHVAAATLDSYAGRYRIDDEPETVLSFFRDGDHLYLEGERVQRYDLTPESDSSFVTADGDYHYHFVTDASGTVTGIRVTGGDSYTLTRVPGAPEHNHFRPYSQEEVMIPMRDGVKLHAIILRPTDTHEALPFILSRTPYGVEGSSSDGINAGRPELAQSGYIFVMEDIRGRYKSEGRFVMMRPAGRPQRSACGGREHGRIRHGRLAAEACSGQ